MRALSAESRISRPSQHNNRKPTRHMPAEEASILIDSLTRRVEADRAARPGSGQHLVPARKSPPCTSCRLGGAARYPLAALAV